MLRSVLPREGGGGGGVTKKVVNGRESSVNYEREAREDKRERMEERSIEK